MTKNPYLDYGDSFFANAARRRPRSHIAQSEKEAPRVLKGAEKAVAEDEEQFRRFKRRLKADLDALLAGPHREGVLTLMRVLKDLTPASAEVLFRELDKIAWFRDADDSTRFLVLGLIDEGICRMRVRQGLAPIDDSLPGEEPTVFEICRERLGEMK